MKRNNLIFVVSIDTEEEWDWHKSFPEKDFSVENARSIPRFQAFCHQYNVRPTYFIDYAIADNPESAEVFKQPLKEGACEIGTHLHPWCTPPVEEKINYRNSYIVNLPEKLVKKKIEVMTQKIETEFGVRPKSFRSGRWGINGAILKMLCDFGYEVDSSIFPFYSDVDFNYQSAPDTPFWPDLKNICKKSREKNIFEIPVTSGFNNPYFEFSNQLFLKLSAPPLKYFKIIGMLWRTGILRKLQLSPELSTAADMISCIKACLKRGHRVIHLFFHSSSLIPKGNPYVQNSRDEEEFYNRMAAVFSFMNAQPNIRFCTISQAKQLYLEEAI